MLGVVLVAPPTSAIEDTVLIEATVLIEDTVLWDGPDG